MPPWMSRCAYLPENFFAYEIGSACGASLVSPSSVYGRHADQRGLRQPLFEVVIFRLALGQAESPAVIMDHDGNVIRVIEGRGAAIERGIVELPHRGSAPVLQLKGRGRR